MFSSFTNIKSYPTLYAIPSENNPNLYTLNEYNSSEDIWCQYGGNGDKQDLSGYYNSSNFTPMGKDQIDKICTV